MRTGAAPEETNKKTGFILGNSSGMAKDVQRRKGALIILACGDMLPG